MKILYFSQTKNVEKFCKKLEYTAESIVMNKKIDEKFILITPTAKLGEIPDAVEEFLTLNYANLYGVIGSGSKNFGKNYNLAAKKISKLYSAKLLYLFELSGTIHDVKKVNEILGELDGK